MSEDIDNPNLRPILGRAGSKYLLRHMIVELIPYHTTYIEAFVGSGAIFFAKPKAEHNILNDLDPLVFDFLKALQKAPVKISDYPESTTLTGHKYLFTHPTHDIVGRIVHAIIQSFDGFYGAVVTKPSQIYKSPSIHNKIVRIQELKSKLKGVKIFSEDYAKVIQKYDGSESFTFLDPPYENTASGWGYAEGSGSFDYTRLASILWKMEGLFLMTLNDSPNIRHIFKGFHMRKFVANTQIRTLIRNELFISNYKLPHSRK